MKNDNSGITLIALTLMVMLLGIIAAVTIYTGIQTIDNFKVETFAKQLEIIQENVNITSKEIKNRNANFINNSNVILIGTAITDIQDNNLNNKITNLFTTLQKQQTSDYRYFNQEALKSINVEGIEGEYVINFSTREVMSLNGLTINGYTYYTLGEVRPKYNIQYENTATFGPTFNIVTQYLSESCRIILTDIEYSGYTAINTTNVQYKLQTSQTWIAVNNTSFEVRNPGIYDVKVTDNSGNSTIKNAYVYVISDLNLYLDGIQNTRNGNNSSATTWEDLSPNSNDAIGYNMNTATGYYNSSGDGYVFLHNDSYFKTTNRIGILGDSLYTIEAVMNPYSNSPYTYNAPLWWGSSEEINYKSVEMSFSNADSVFQHAYVHNPTRSDNTYSIIGSTCYYSVKKVGTGAITYGNTNMIKMNYNGTPINSTYIGTQAVTANLVDSPVEIGRAWQISNINRTFNGTIKAIRIYSRDLTNEEISLNANIDSQRFGFVL